MNMQIPVLICQEAPGIGNHTFHLDDYPYDRRSKPRRGRLASAPDLLDDHSFRPFEESHNRRRRYASQGDIYDEQEMTSRYPMTGTVIAKVFHNQYS